MHSLAASDNLRLDVNVLDYAILAVYFAVVIGIGLLARRSIATSEDFFLSGRALSAWVTGLALISANLGAIEILGMAANGAQYGLSTVHFYWIGAVPAMVFRAVHDALLLLVTGAQRPGVHAPAVQHRQPPRSACAARSRRTTWRQASCRWPRRRARFHSR